MVRTIALPLSKALGGLFCFPFRGNAIESYARSGLLTCMDNTLGIYRLTDFLDWAYRTGVGFVVTG
jgi:hypothetical protein